MVDTTGSPYYNDAEHAIAQNYVEFLAIPGRVLQAREVTQLQTIIRERQKRIADSIFDDGDIVEGIVLNIYKDGADYFAQVSAGRVYAQGDIWDLEAWPPTNINTIVTGEAVIGLAFNEAIVTEVTDPKLRDPALGYDNYNQPGCHRLQRVPTWTIIQSGPGAVEVPIFRLSDGLPISVPIKGLYGEIVDFLARRTYDESGHYLVKGLKVNDHGQSSSDPDKIDISVDPGKAFIMGYEIIKPVAERLEVDRSLETALSSNELFKFYWPRPVFGQAEDGITTDTLKCTAINDEYGFNPSIYGSKAGSSLTVTQDTFTFTIDGLQVSMGPGPTQTPVPTGTNLMTAIADDINTAYHDAAGSSLDVCFVVGTSPNTVLVLRSPTCDEYSYVYISPTDFNGEIGFWGSQYMGTPIGKWVYNFDTSEGRQVKSVTTFDSAEPSGNPGATVLEFYTKSDDGHELDDPYCDAWATGAEFAMFSFSTSSNAGSVLHKFTHQPVESIFTGYEGVSGFTLLEVQIERDGTSQDIVPGNVDQVFAIVDNFATWNWVEDPKNNDSSAPSGVFPSLGWPGYYTGFTDAWEEDTHYQISGDTITWISGGPGNGDTYRVLYSYNKTMLDEGNPGIGSGDWQLLNLGGFSYLDMSPGFRPGNRSGIGDGDQQVPSNSEGAISQAYIDYYWYLARRDILIIDQEGNLDIIAGKPDTESLVEAPTGPLNSLTIAQVYLPPAGLNATITNFRIERVTMEQINKMRDRINELEYNTALALMDEQSREGANPDELAGIMSDAFLGLQQADLTYDDGTVSWNACIDHLERCIILPYTETSNELTVGNILPGSIYEILNGGFLISAPTDGTEPEVVLLSQRYGTGIMNINPYEVYDKDPRVFLAPQVDNWMDITKESVIQQLKMPTIYVNVWHDIPKWLTKEELQILQELWRTGWSQNNNFWEGQQYAVTERVTTSTSVSIIDEAITYMREREVAISGKSFPSLMDNLYVRFDGQEVVLTSGTHQDPGNPGRVKADINGEWEATFQVPGPATSLSSVRTGSRTVEVWYGGGSPDSLEATVNYTASGTQRTIIETIYRGGIVLRGQDPLAQTFSFDYDVVLTGLGLYFASKAVDDADGVTVQIREVVNGYPGPFSYGEKVIKPSEITIDDEFVNVEHKFYFDAPIFLEAYKEYCVVLMSDTNLYQVAVGTLGEQDLATGEWVANQPYSVGVLFSSSNNSTWTTEQKSDLKFKMYGAKFEDQGSLTPAGTITWADVVVDYTRFILSVDWVTPVGCRIEWEYSYNSGSTWFPCFPFVIIDAGGPTSGLAPHYRTKIMIRAKLYTDNSRISPMISTDSIFLHTRIYEDEGNYIGLPVSGAEYNNVTQTIKAYKPTGTQMKLFFQMEAGGDWIENQLVSYRDLSNGFTLFEYEHNIVVDEPDITSAAFRLGDNMGTSLPFTPTPTVNDTVALRIDGTLHEVTLTGGPYATVADVAAAINTAVGVNVASEYAGNRMLIQSPTVGWNHSVASPGGKASMIQLINDGLNGLAWTSAGCNFDSSIVSTTGTDKYKWPGSVGAAVGTGGSLDTGNWWFRVVATNADGETTVDGGVSGDEAVAAGHDTPINLTLGNQKVTFTFDQNLFGSTWNPRTKVSGFKIYGVQGSSWANVLSSGTWRRMTPTSTESGGVPTSYVLDGSFSPVTENPASDSTAFYDVDYYRARIYMAHDEGYEYNTPVGKEFTNAFKSI